MSELILTVLQYFYIYFGVFETHSYPRILNTLWNMIETEITWVLARVKRHDHLSFTPNSFKYKRFYDNAKLHYYDSHVPKSHPYPLNSSYNPIIQQTLHRKMTITRYRLPCSADIRTGTRLHQRPAKCDNDVVSRQPLPSAAFNQNTGSYRRGHLRIYFLSLAISSFRNSV